MTSTTLSEEVIPLTYGGFSYSGRIVHRPNARLAPLVLIGGAFQHQGAWGRLERMALESMSVITVDLPGWGAADRLPARYGIDFLCGALDQLLAKAAPYPVNVMGASYGSAVAHEWVRRHPGRAERLVLVGTMAQLTDHVRARVELTLRMLERGSHAEFVDQVLDTLICRAPRVTVARRATVIRCLTRALNELTADGKLKYRENTRRLLDHPAPSGGPVVRIPVLVTTGEHDPLTTPALSREASARCADARFAVFKDADHLVHLERPAELLDLVLKFLADEPLTGLDYCHPVEYPGHRVPVPSPRAGGER
ncbi:alpha/beta hydrolase [Streptomyces sp. AV19]|uniref:alpha/beta fold hydrolase n=1 Tax=Streptomyces sp. AV19 TaxID=2793068 RepID=UPI0018FF0077|nr:alpha/beta hydrolase [Streptomyces sp. AV19]MBH1937910.1 alpha/beta hydrolase [Streptomyces sp. AV19]MDG4536547.1 alpha/beta hydrolase [Streptomyces sp. AV19]